MHYLLFYEVCDDYVSRRAPFRQEHLALAWASHSRDELILGGAVSAPLDSEGMAHMSDHADGAILLFRGDSPLVAEAFALQDPYVRNGLVKRWYVRTWNTVAGADATNPVRPESL